MISDRVRFGVRLGSGTAKAEKRDVDLEGITSPAGKRFLVFVRLSCPVGVRCKIHNRCPVGLSGCPVEVPELGKTAGQSMSGSNVRLSGPVPRVSLVRFFVRSPSPRGRTTGQTPNKRSCKSINADLAHHEKIED